MFLVPQLVFIILSVLSHVGASLFFAKPRFNKIIIALIWLLYGFTFFILPPDTPPVSYFISFLLHLILFFITTKGRTVEKVFLFFSYATTYTCFSTLFNMFEHALDNLAMKIIVSILLMTAMQIILYMVLLPSFKKIAHHIHKGWAKFHCTVISFWILIVSQSLFTMMRPMTNQEIVVFLFTALAFCITYIALFNSMKNIVELSREKQKSLNAELLQTQVDAQAKEAKIVAHNRHDMRHHYQALMSLAAEGEMDKIIDYLKLQSESIESMSTGRYCENETINNILKVYHQKAKNQNISIDICAAAKPSVSVPSPALVTIVANILENALHGAIESKSTSPYIKVLIKHKAGRLVITCENSCVPSLDFEEMPEYLQGIGIQSIISTTEKYNGSCRFSASDGIFTSTTIIDE